MNRPTALLARLLLDAERLCGVSTTKDVETIRHRIVNEGYSFLTITLPILSDFLERGIEAGRLDPKLGRTFRFQSRRRLPRFLGGFFSRVFDDTGMLLSNACPDAILAIRQISRSFKKIFEVCDERRNSAAAARYLTIEEELKTHDDCISRPDPMLDQVASWIGRDFAWPFRCRKDSEVAGLSSSTDARSSNSIREYHYPEGTFPRGVGIPDAGNRDASLYARLSQAVLLETRHGPGVTAERRSPNGRFSFRSWPSRANELYPMADYAIPNWGCMADLGSVRELAVDEEPPVRVVFVPKTALTPRVIAVEPSTMQYLQQGVMQWMVSAIESAPLTRGHINFSDQSVNQQLAHRGSMTRWLATIDMKDASDRVHYGLAKRILQHTAFWEYLDASRSRTAVLPDGNLVSLSKFASMGSATCFPVEAYVFYCLIISAIHIHWKQIPTYESVQIAIRDVYVYGDDIVIPSAHVDHVCEYLESYGLLVNRNKSFSNSHFRESCGADFYSGHTVKPVYFRQHLPSPNVRWTPKQLLSWVSASNQLYMAGWWSSSQLIRDWVEREVGRVPRLRVKLRENRYDNPNGVAFASVAFNTELMWSKDYQAFGWKILDFKMKTEKDPILTYSGGLFKAFSNIGQDHSVDFMSSRKRDGFSPKHRWVGLTSDSHL